MLSLKTRILSHIKARILNVKCSKREFGEHHKQLKHNVYITTKDNKKIGAYLFEPRAGEPPRGFFIALHGKGCSREGFVSVSRIDVLLDMGYCVLVPDYRGFADSEGEFEVEDVNLDIMACFDYLISRFGEVEVHMIGHSLGTGIIGEYCRYIRNNNVEARYHPRKTVMISPFTSMSGRTKPFFGLLTSSFHG